MAVTLPLLNESDATFDCSFGRGCDGVCCREGRPPVYPDEIAIITPNLERFLPLLRPTAQAVVKARGYLSPRQRRLGQPILRIADGWCVFFNKGCVLHQVGDAEGDKYRYKPSLCSLFPIQQDSDENWYVRQQGYHGEAWNLFCLNPANSARPARESLREEIALALRYDTEQKLAVEQNGD